MGDPPPAPHSPLHSEVMGRKRRLSMTENGNKCPQVWASQGEVAQLSQLSQRKLHFFQNILSPVGTSKWPALYRDLHYPYNFDYSCAQVPHFRDGNAPLSLSAPQSPQGLLSSCHLSAPCWDGKHLLTFWRREKEVSW